MYGTNGEHETKKTSQNRLGIPFNILKKAPYATSKKKIEV